ncbi:DNA polymerase III [Mesobacillus campisalis]|uniref:DNA polymerase III n=1 Tax=Mesobacillus campisalis TaxID=1408103 RepID=A0A0M2SXG4_9BACI|nr:3'-5' exonuclease [Mesobacillus campisalis]KKK38848.1 DNA polymerase III [Mesobacillus campisalis]
MFFQRKTIHCPVSYGGLPLSTSVEELSFVVFDTEATGFQVAGEDRLIEIGAVHVQGMEVIEEDVFQTYVNPKRQISQEITQLTSISMEKVEQAPEASEAILSFFDYVETRQAACLVGHYVSFDSLVLKHELKRGNKNLKGLQTLDTLNMIGFIAPSYDMRDLERYAMAFGTRIYDRHSALGDALTTAYLFVELLRHFKDRGHTTWADLLKGCTL